MRSRSPYKNLEASMGTAGGPRFGLPPGIDSSILTEAEIEKLLKITSEKSLNAIAFSPHLYIGVSCLWHLSFTR